MILQFGEIGVKKRVCNQIWETEGIGGAPKEPAIKYVWIEIIDFSI